MKHNNNKKSIDHQKATMHKGKIMRKAIQRILILPILTTLLCATHASATVVPQQPLNELLDATSFIFIGEVIELDEYAWEEDTGNPQTEVMFSVNEVIDGDYAEDTIKFTLPYGYLEDDSYFEIVGSPHFLEGEEYLLFVRDGDWYLTPITNWYWSVFRNETIDGTEYWVTQDGLLLESFDSNGAKIGPKVADSEIEKDIKANDKKEMVKSSKVEDDKLAESTDLFSKETKYDILDTLEWLLNIHKKDSGAKTKEIQTRSKKNLNMVIQADSDNEV